MIQPPKLVWDGADWLLAATAIAAVLFALLLAAYWRAGSTRPVRILAAGLKTLGILILILCLLEPYFSEQRARPGANQFAVLADNSQSMTLKDGDQRTSRGDFLKSLTETNARWLAQIGRDFDLRQFAFDSQLRSVENFEALPFDGRSSELGAALDRLLRRFQGRPLAGVLLLTDGCATDSEAVERLLARAAGDPANRVPIYPVLVGRPTSMVDISVDRIAVTQTSFEDAPVTLTAQITTSGELGRMLVVELLDEQGKSIEQQKVKVEQDGEPLAIRFRLKPEQPGISFYRVRAASESHIAQFEHPEKTDEATLANNSRMVAVDRGQGPYRVLYVSGRPNWEYKFLDRSVSTDDQIQLVGMIRVAKREPKFNFATPTNDANPLFSGFVGKNAPEDVQQYDQPVIVRQGIADESELKGGFPKAAEDLFRYHAVILDDLESEFFNQDQLQLIKEFVRQRGGGLLMIGGQETFKNGLYGPTAIGDLLPVYIDQVPDFPPDARYHLTLTREGWLEPWLRLRGEEDLERQRLSAMPAFQTLSPIRGIKPGATVLARVTLDDGSLAPALVEQRFGRGRAAAQLIGDLWRWELRRPEDSQSDLGKAWRQTVRWLVSDVPQRVEVTVDTHREPDDADGALRLVVQARDPSYAPLDNATVTLHITPPDGKPVDLRAEPSQGQSGRYEALYVPRQTGPFRVQATAAAPEGTTGTRPAAATSPAIAATKPAADTQAQAGWTSDPAADEFRQLQPNTALLDRIAAATGGQVVAAADLEKFVATLPTRHAPITEPFIRPFWHQAAIFLLAIACLAAEWGLRRWKGLP